MKILFVLPYVPIPANFGGALRVYHLLRLAAQRNDISVISYGTPDQEKELREHLGPRLREVTIVPFTHWPVRYRRLAQAHSLISRHSVLFNLAQSGIMRETLKNRVQKQPYDIIQTEFAHMGSYALETEAVRLLDAHNVEYDNYRRMWVNSRSPLRGLHYRSEYKKFHREEIGAILNQDALIVTSMRDKQILDRDVPERVKYVVPNGVDAKYFSPGDLPPEPFSLVFTGVMSYLPNYDGMLHFLDNIFPLIQKQIPEAKLYIVGSGPPKALQARASDHVVVTGFVDDVRPYVWRSSVYVVPLRMGGGTRLKVLESMSMKKPIVSTAVGSEGIDVRNGESILLADDPAEFADAVVRLLRDQPLRFRMIQNGYELVRSRYEWSVIGQELEKIYGTIVSSQEHST